MINIRGRPPAPILFIVISILLQITFTRLKNILLDTMKVTRSRMWSYCPKQTSRPRLKTHNSFKDNPNYFCKYNSGLDHYKPLLPVTVTEELRNRVYELEVKVAVTDTMLNLEVIRRQNLINDLMEISTLEQLQKLQSKYK